MTVVVLQYASSLYVHYPLICQSCIIALTANHVARPVFAKLLRQSVLQAVRYAATMLAQQPQFGFCLTSSPIAGPVTECARRARGTGGASEL